MASRAAQGAGAEKGHACEAANFREKRALCDPHPPPPRPGSHSALSRRQSQTQQGRNLAGSGAEKVVAVPSAQHVLPTGTSRARIPEQKRERDASLHPTPAAPQRDLRGGAAGVRCLPGWGLCGFLRSSPGSILCPHKQPDQGARHGAGLPGSKENCGKATGSKGSPRASQQKLGVLDPL